MAADAAERWPDERAAGPFFCHADFSLDNHLDLLREVSQLQRDLMTQLELGESREPIHLFLFANKKTYETYLKTYFPKVPYRRALYIKARGPGMVFAHANDEFEVDVRHECTHALLHAAMPVVPFWLDEGLAEYFEVRKTERPLDNPHLKSLKWDLLLSKVATVDDLAKINELSQMGRTQYRHAWAWVHFMLHGPDEARDELIRYLGDLQAHAPTAELHVRLRRRLPNIDRLLIEHFKTWRR